MRLYCIGLAPKRCIKRIGKCVYLYLYLIVFDRVVPSAVTGAILIECRQYIFSLYRSVDRKQVEGHFFVYKDKVPVLVQICREVINNRIGQTIVNVITIYLYRCATSVRYKNCAILWSNIPAGRWHIWQHISRFTMLSPMPLSIVN